MKIKALEITRRESYQPDPNMLVGVVRLEGENGSMEVRLSPDSLSAIFDVVRQQVNETAKANAKEVPAAMAAAAAEPLLESRANLSIES